ncbi:MAG: HEPN domain-containing protein [Planctomycetes bacterium]|nr:HEPN domain-containing protein [Planctomycetota bacterium]
MKSSADLAKGWFAKAESDLANARTMVSGPGPYDTACFHCQQAVEKYMKAFLAWRGQPFPFTHDLERLARLCEATESSLKLAVPEVVALTDYAVKLRYDNDFWPSRQDVADALAVVEGVRSMIVASVPPLAHP